MQALNLVNLVLMGVAVWVTVKLPEMHTAFGFAEVNYGFASILTGVMLGVITPLTGILTNAYSRRAEYRADHQAVEEGYGEALISGLKKLGKENFTHLAPAKLLVVLNYSHPPLSQRIEAIEKARK
jgi:STE24 endopeptidase